jgi:hypothetical protein
MYSIRILHELSCVPSRNQYNEETRNDTRLISHVQDEPSWRDHMVEAFRPFGGDGRVKIFQSEAFP